MERDSVILSVIIPAYNVEKYIEKCLSSVLTQINSENSIEVIVIVDGATDNTFAEIMKTVGYYGNPNTRIINQENTGLSGARNVGLSLASGKYVTFLDGDDYWLPSYIVSVMSILCNFQPDILEYNALLTDEKGNPFSLLKISCANLNTIACTGQESFLDIFRCYAWARIYRRELFHRSVFTFGRRFEDTSTIPWIYWQASVVTGLGIPLIGYRQHSDSILSLPRLSDIFDLNLAVVHALKMYEETNHEFWLRVSYRIFQQSCTRTALLPFRLWHQAIELATKNVINKLPFGGSFSRRILVSNPFFYTLLIFLKRKSYDRFIKFLDRIKFKRNSTYLVP